MTKYFSKYSLDFFHSFIKKVYNLLFIHSYTAISILLFDLSMSFNQPLNASFSFRNIQKSIGTGERQWISSLRFMGVSLNITCLLLKWKFRILSSTLFLLSFFEWIISLLCTYVHLNPFGLATEQKILLLALLLKWNPPETKLFTIVVNVFHLMSSMDNGDTWCL